MSIDTRIVLSKLNALNTIVSYSGIAPVLTNEEVNDSPDHLLASNVLDEVIEQTCARTMPCNTDYEYPLDADGDGFIVIPEGAITVLPESKWSERLVERDGKLYDLRERTFVINDTIKTTITWLLQFESLPQVVRKYITINSAMRFLSRFKGDDAVLATAQDDLRRAQAEYLRYVEQTSNVNMFNNPELNYITERDSRTYRRY